MRLDDHPQLKQWVKGCAMNKRSCQKALYNHYFDAMNRMVYRYTQDEDVLITIINNGFLNVFKNIDQYRFTGSLEGWIRTIVFRALSDYFRKENRRVKHIHLLEHDEISRNPGLKNLYYEDVLQLIAKLPDRSRQVFELHAIEGYKHREIADLLQISEGTSKWHLAEARKTLQQIVKLKDKHNYV